MIPNSFEIIKKTGQKILLRLENKILTNTWKIKEYL